MRFIYFLFIKIYPLIAHLLALKNEKANKWVEGRRHWTINLQKHTATWKQEAVIWMHCSSLGEFEQGRPLIEAIKQKYPNHKIVLSFFSPSGYEVQKKYAYADAITYLPMDGKRNALLFYDIVKPKLVVFVKYDFWFYFINEAYLRNIPIILVSSIFRSNQLFFKWYGAFYRTILKRFNHIFVQNEESKTLLHTISIDGCSVAGDTRYDRVLQIALESKSLPLIETISTHKKVIVAGSTWHDDHILLQQLANNFQDLLFIIAPHDVGKTSIQQALQLFEGAVLYTSISDQKDAEQLTSNVLMIDTVGILNKLYRYAHVCYVGGGFTKDGIHNVLEAAVYGKPVVTGPEYRKYVEAKGLVAAGGMFPVKDAHTLQACIQKLLNDNIYYNQVCMASASFVKQNGGATAKMLDYIYENRLLTN